MVFSRQEYRSGLPFLSPGDLLNPGIEPRSPALQADALTSEPPGKPRNLPAMQETEARSLGQEDNLDNGILQYSRLENSTDRGAWQVTVHRVTNSQT